MKQASEKTLDWLIILCFVYFYVKPPENFVKKMFKILRNISELYVNVYCDICAVIVLNYKNGSHMLL